jgi:acyl-CoA thioester hydrolase
MKNFCKTTCRVIYGDTDTMGYAYYGNYMRWFEIGRTELFREWGLTYKSIEESGVFLPVSETYCKYFSPVRYDDILVIETQVDPGIKGGVKFDYRIFKQEPETLCAAGYTKHACVDRQGAVIRPPKFLSRLIHEKCRPENPNPPEGL